MHKLLLVIFAILLIACSPKVKTKLLKSYPSLETNTEVAVLGFTEAVPASATEIGRLKVKDAKRSKDCNWDATLEIAKAEARKAGGNILKLTNQSPLNAFARSCDAVEAKVFKLENLAEIKAENKDKALHKDWNYAKVYVYWSGGLKVLVPYSLYLDDTFIGKMKFNSAQEIRITEKGPHSIWIKEQREEVPINIEIGREYYVRCSVRLWGIYGTKPWLTQVENLKGKYEYEALKKEESGK